MKKGMEKPAQGKYDSGRDAMMQGMPADEMGEGGTHTCKYESKSKGGGKK